MKQSEKALWPPQWNSIYYDIQIQDEIQANGTTTYLAPYMQRKSSVRRWRYFVAIQGQHTMLQRSTIHVCKINYHANFPVVISQ